MRLFTYGTLKRGFGNHRLLRGAAFIGTATTVNNFIMLDAGFPVLLQDKRGHRVEGEIYDITPDMLPALDRLEGEGHMYFRQPRFVRMADGKLCRVHMYVGTPSWRHRGPKHGAYWLGDDDVLRFNYRRAA